jgi:hypothetical protein
MALALLALVLLAMAVSGCVDLFTNKEVVSEVSWHGRVTDAQGNGIANATVTLHVLNDKGEVYQRQAHSTSSGPMPGLYSFEYIDLRDGADRAYTTCSVAAGNVTLSAIGQVRSLLDGAQSSTLGVDGENVTVISYEGTVDERLVLS